MPLPPLSRLRKGVVFFTLLIVVFVLYRLLIFKIDTDSDTLEKELPSIHTEMCLFITPLGPMNADSVFHLKNGLNKIFAYSSFISDVNTSDTIWHIWYNGSKTVKTAECILGSNACFSSISADSLAYGDWSIDVMQNDILLSLRQFKIER